MAADLGDAAAYRHMDVTSEPDWEAAVAFAEERFGPLTILVNNAGILDFGPVQDQDVERFRKVIDVNLVGTLIGIKVARRLHAAKAGGGSIINISSNAGIVGPAPGVGLRVEQVGGPGLVEVGGPGPRPARHPGELRAPRRDRHPDGRGRATRGPAG